MGGLGEAILEPPIPEEVYPEGETLLLKQMLSKFGRLKNLYSNAPDQLIK